MRFRLRTLFCLVTVAAVVCYALTTRPFVFLRSPRVRPNQVPSTPYTGPDYFECTLVNGGYLPFYVQSYADFSREMTVWRPTQPGEVKGIESEWFFDLEWHSSIYQPDLGSWKLVPPGDSVQMRREFTSNQADRRIKIDVEITDWLGRTYEIRSQEMKHHADGSIDAQGLQNNPMDTKRRIDRSGL